MREEELVPYSNQASVANPLGFTLPFRVAPSLLTPDASEVDTVGGSGTISPSSRFAPCRWVEEPEKLQGPDVSVV